MLILDKMLIIHTIRNEHNKHIGQIKNKIIPEIQDNRHPLIISTSIGASILSCLIKHTRWPFATTLYSGDMGSYS